MLNNITSEGLFFVFLFYAMPVIFVIWVAVAAISTLRRIASVLEAFFLPGVQPRL